MLKMYVLIGSSTKTQTFIYCIRHFVFHLLIKDFPKNHSDKEFLFISKYIANFL